MSHLLLTLLFLLPGTPLRAVPSDSLWTLYDSAYAAYEHGDYRRCIELGDEGIALTPADSGEILMAFYSTHFVAYFRLGDYEQALHYGEQTLKYDEQSGDKPNLANSLANLSGVYSVSGQIDVAERYLLRAILLDREYLEEDTSYTKSKLAIHEALLGEVYYTMAFQSKDTAARSGYLSDGIRLTRDALDIDRSLGRDFHVAARLAQLANLYDLSGDYSRAEKLNNEALEKCRQTGNASTELIVMRQLGRLYMHLADKHPAQAAQYESRAEETLLACLSKAEEIGYLKLQAEVCELMYRLEAQRMRRGGRVVPALDWAERAQALKDSLRQTELDSHLAMWEVRYDTQEKEQQIQLQQIEMEEMKSSRVYLMIILIVCLIAIIAFIAVLILISKNKRKVEMLAQQKDRHYNVLSHDLKNPMVAQQQVLRMVYENYPSFTGEQIHANLGKLLANSDMQIGMLGNLQEMTLLEMDRRKATLSRLDLMSAVSDVLPAMQPVADLKNIRFSVTPERVLVTADRDMVRTVLRNLLSNAIKFSYEGGTIDISVQPEGSITVRDHGVGMSAPQQEAILRDCDTTLASTLGTAGESGTGIGLQICRSLLRLMDASLSVESAPGQGSAFTIAFRKAEETPLGAAPE